MSQIITFTDGIGISKNFYPKPSSFYIPDWYSNMDSYRGKDKKPNGLGSSSGTIKRCMPVFDVITAGYIITTYTDVFISQKPTKQDGLEIEVDKPYYEWPTANPIAFHDPDQALTHPLYNNAPYPKWISPWGISTPPGYSCIFINPVHRESVFSIMEGIVDTDKYNAPVNFPFVLKDVNFEGLIPAGTPIAQVIPFKREEWKMQIGNYEDLEKQSESIKRLRSKIFDSYKSQYRQIKKYT
jgi:hypothetical protein